MKAGNARILTINGGSSSIKFVLYQNALVAKKESDENLLILDSTNSCLLQGAVTRKLCSR
jgi:acetate kinase